MLEASNAVGGIARTEVYDGYRFDIGGHRFFTKVPEVEELWHEILPARLCEGQAPQPHLLQGILLRVSAQALQRPGEPRRVRELPDPPQLRQVAGEAEPA